MSDADETVKKVKKPRLLVIDRETEEPIHAFKLTQTTPRHVEKAKSGLTRNMNKERYYVKEDL